MITNSNMTYKGFIVPEESNSKTIKWFNLLKERYLLAQQFCVNKSVLDTCCGTGWGTINSIAPVCNYVVGIDLYDHSKVSSIPDNCKFLTMDARHINLNSKDFDIVLSLEAIEHFSQEDVKSYFNGIKNSLKEDGILLGTTPLIVNDSLSPIFLHWNKYHIFMYTKNILHCLLRAYFNFYNIYEVYHHTMPFFLFVCSDYMGVFNSSNIDYIENHLKINRLRYSINRQFHSFLWIASLIKRLDIRGAGSLLINSNIGGGIKDILTIYNSIFHV